MTSPVLSICTSPLPISDSEAVQEVKNELEVRQEPIPSTYVRESTEPEVVEDQLHWVELWTPFDGPFVPPYTGPKPWTLLKAEAEARKAKTGPKFIPISDDLCWRCGKQGHRRDRCINRKLLFCSRCGKVGMMSRTCKCNGSTHKSTRQDRAPVGDTVTQSYRTHRCQSHNQSRTPCRLCGCPFT